MGHYNKPPTFLKRSFRHWLYTILSFVLTMEAMSELDLLHQMGDSFSFLSSPPFISTATGWSSKCPACKYFSKWASILPASWLKSCLGQFGAEAYVDEREVENVSFTIQTLQVDCTRWFMLRLRFLEGNQIFSLYLSFTAQHHSFFSFSGQ